MLQSRWPHSSCRASTIHYVLCVLGAEFGLLGTSLDVRWVFVAVEVATPLVGCVHHPVSCVLRAELGLVGAEFALRCPLSTLPVIESCVFRFVSCGATSCWGLEPLSLPLPLSLSLPVHRCRENQYIDLDDSGAFHLNLIVFRISSSLGQGGKSPKSRKARGRMGGRDSPAAQCWRTCPRALDVGCTLLPRISRSLASGNDVVRNYPSPLMTLARRIILIR